MIVSRDAKNSTSIYIKIFHEIEGRILSKHDKKKSLFWVPISVTY